MTNNRMYLVCTHHPDQRQAMLLGKRIENGYYRCPQPKELEAWLDEHKHCGGTHDHFTVAFEKPKDYDIHVEAAVNGAHA